MACYGRGRMAGYRRAPNACAGSKQKEGSITISAPPRDGEEDAWAFLELVDAPQWTDLSLEARLIGQEGDDPWFHHSHLHHQNSLEKMVRQSVQPRVLCSQQQVKGGRASSSSSSSYKSPKEVGPHQHWSVLRAHWERRGQLKNVGRGQSWPRSQVKRIQLQSSSSPSQDESLLEVLGCTPNSISSSSSSEFDYEKLILEEEKHKLSCGDIASCYRMSGNDPGNSLHSIQETGKHDIARSRCISLNDQENQDIEGSFFLKPGTQKQVPNHVNVFRLSSECRSEVISQPGFQHSVTYNLRESSMLSSSRKLETKIQKEGYEYTRILSKEPKKKSILSDRNNTETQKIQKNVVWNTAYLSLMNGESSMASKENAYSYNQNQEFQTGSLVSRALAKCLQTSHYQQEVFSSNVLTVGIVNKSMQKVHTENILGSKSGISDAAKNDLTALIDKHNREVCWMSKQGYRDKCLTVRKRTERHLR